MMQFNDGTAFTDDQDPKSPAPRLASKKPRKRAVAIGLVTFLFGILTVSALRGTDNGSVLENARESDLVILLDSLTSRLARLQAEQIELSNARSEILNGTDAEALASTRGQLFAMQVLNGTVPVQGQGIIVEISDPKKQVTYDVLLSMVQELRDAGAEAIDIDGVRLNGRSWIGGSYGSEVIRINSVAVTAPYTVKVIGSSATLQVALEIPGGVADTVASLGGKLKITPENKVLITTTVPDK